MAFFTGIVSAINLVLLIIFGAVLLAQGAAPFTGIAIAALVFGILNVVAFFLVERNEEADTFKRVLAAFYTVIHWAGAFTGFAKPDDSDIARAIGIYFIVFGLLSLIAALYSAYIFYMRRESTKPGFAKLPTQETPTNSVFWGEIPQYPRMPNISL